MITGFKTKKIKSPLNLSQRLKAGRKKLDVSLEEAEIATKVRLKFLKALEEEHWLHIAPLPYVRGFVLAYAKYLGIKKDEILELFDEEVAASKHRGANQFVYEKKIKETRVIVTPKVLGYSFLSLAAFSMFGYIVYQVLSFAGNPNLKIVSPNNNSVIESDSIDIQGLADTDTYLTINAESVPVTNDGHFAANIKLHRGLNVIKVKATNKTEKSTTEVITVEYKPKTAQAEDPLQDRQ